MAFRTIVTFLLVAAGIFGLASGPGAAAGLETPAKQALLVDFDTGAVLLEKDADSLMPPASMSKLMTVYMLFERLADNSLKLEDTFPVSEKAWRKGGSKMFVEVGKRVAVEDLIRGIVVQSGNDACIVVAEALGGSEENFAAMMTERARELGLTSSTFRNATGWPDPEHMMSARDLTLLARRLITDFPQFYGYFAEKRFTFAGIPQGNRNPLLYKNGGADGLKTGHTEASGYGITASAKRGERRLILVVNGLESIRQRSTESDRLLEWGFRHFANYAFFQAGDTVSEAETWLGDIPQVPLVSETDINATMPVTARRNMKVKVRYQGPIPAPIAKGDRIATLVISGKGMDDIEYPLVAGTDVGRLGPMGRITAALSHLIFGAASAVVK